MSLEQVEYLKSFLTVVRNIMAPQFCMAENVIPSFSKKDID
jgi:hypothetical protein